MSLQETTSRLRDISPSRKEVDLEVPSEDVQREYERVLDDYAAKVKLPGFRRGHAPKDMVRRLFDQDIKHDVYDALVPRVLHQELRRLGLKPVTVPVLRDIKDAEGEPLRCTAAFEVLPDFDLPDYRSVKVAKKSVDVSEKDVDQALEEVRARAAEYTPVEGRGAGEGDYVVVEMQGRDVRTRRLLPVEKAVVLAGHPENEPALNERLIGMTAGEERTFEVSYPKDHPNRRVAGKDISYTLRAVGVKERKLPELNDEFAKSVGRAAGLQALREGIRNELQAARERAGRSATAAEVLAQIAARVPLELPETLVEEETLAVMKRALANARERRVSKEALEGLKAEARKQALDQLRNRLILEKIARIEGLRVEEQEIRTELRALAQANQVPEAYLEEYMGQEDRREELAESLLFRKTVDFLVKNAIMS